jgi:glycosyltransferase involved in cell wall biosynthesis
MMRFKRRSRIRIGYIKKEKKSVFVISAIRVKQGGALEVVKDLLTYIDSNPSAEFEYLVFVYKTQLYGSYRNIKLREFRNVPRSFVYRLWMEYVGFYFLSKKIKPCVWLSMQDSTPNVVAQHRYVYWQNALPQRGIKLKDLLVDSKLFFISLLYKYLYCRNLRRNDTVFVQQRNLKEFMVPFYGLANDKIKVAPLNLNHWSFETAEKVKRSLFIYLYPCYPYAYKNLESIIKSVSKDQINDFEIWFTCNGNENRYISQLHKDSEGIQSIKWIGFQPTDRLEKLYKEADALVFMSGCESWGIPISVFKQMQKPIVIADLPYAHETISDYSLVKFVNPKDERSLSTALKNIALGTIEYDRNLFEKEKDLLLDWQETTEFIYKGIHKASLQKQSISINYNIERRIRP